jgi:hypothetical protein
VDRSGGAVELGFAEGEDSAVGCDHPAPAAVGRRRHSYYRIIQLARDLLIVGCILEVIDGSRAVNNVIPIEGLAAESDVASRAVGSRRTWRALGGQLIVKRKGRVVACIVVGWRISISHEASGASDPEQVEPATKKSLAARPEK